MIRQTLSFAILVVMTGSAPVLALSLDAGGTQSAQVEARDRARQARDRERQARDSNQSEESERFTGTYRVGASGALDLTQIAGDVTVTTQGGDEVRIEAVKRVRQRDAQEAKRLLSALRIDVTQVGSRVEVRTVHPTGNRGWSGRVDYTISVPPNTAVAVKTVSGDVSITGVQGEVRAETVSGNVDVTETPNLAMAKAVSGDVRAQQIAGSSLALQSVSGTIIATGLKVRTLDVGSVSGDLRLSDLQTERLTAKTLSGDIQFGGRVVRGGRYEFTAHSGDVRLALAPDIGGFELDASTFSGAVRSDFPVTLRSNAFQQSGRQGSRSAIRGTYGDAGAILAVRSFSGNVVITNK